MPDDLAISAVIPCYNSEATIGRAITSVLQQTKPVKEILVVDDASCDGSLLVVNEMKAQSVIPIHTRQLLRNSGPASARNLGWNSASGHYIAFLDADDWWHPKKIEIQSEYLSRNPDVILSGHRRMLAMSGSGKLRRAHAILEKPTFKVVSWPTLLMANPFATSSVILKANISLRFDVEMRRCEDALLWCEVTYSGYFGHWTAEPLSFTQKQDFGAGGLSGDLWEMARWQRAMIKKLRKKRMVSWPAYRGLLAWSWIKLMRRYGIVAARRWQ